MVKEKKRSTCSWLAEFAGIHKNMYVGSVLLAIVGVAFSIAPYFVIADIISRLLNGDKNLNVLLMECVIMACMWLLRVVFHCFSTTLSHKATFHVLGSMKKRCLDKLGRISLGAVQDRSSGALKNTIVERIDSIEITLAHIVPEFTSNLLGALCLIIYLFSINWKMGFVSLITLPVGLLCYMGMMIGYEKDYGRTVKATKDLNDSAVEYIGGIEVIKVFGKVKSSYERFIAAAKEGAASYIDWMRKCNFFFSFALVILPANLITILPIGALMIRGGTLSVQSFILITILSLSIITPIITCASYTDDIRKVGLIVSEVTSILEEADIVRPETDKAVPIDNSVVFKDVHFSYKEAEVLHGVNLSFKQGSVNALVGPSGSGKSTIAKLLASYWDVDSGSISIGGVDIRDLSSENYFKRVAYVSQDNFLFNESVRENIRMGRLDATDQEVEEAAKNCGCHDFIMSLENGYDTIVGDAGGHLSGGERQRIAIARAMLKDAPIVILDEATSYTDPENEAIIQDSVARLVKGKTLIVIAHRLSTIIDSDQIVVVNNGNIDSTGTHEQLLESSKLYASLWQSHIVAKDSLGGAKNV